ncbi:PREDICTED: WD repeat-containing protein 92 [Galeopterus variegatus]|uniref:WD repeat-containing protein 92 n=1 Tax=Galeopterus variegatus TaxID=482537 RepID=A0ABM0Q081_GALVR|nr:PREDICTED: WD repeat-containing protein 92 [Galeopterus variegatus]
MRVGENTCQIYIGQRIDIQNIQDIEKAKPIKCGTFGATSLQQRYLATGDFDENLQIWKPQKVNAEKKHDHSLLNFANLLLLMTGTVKVWDPRQKDDPVANMEPVQGENKRDCWTVGFGNAYNQEERVVCAGYDNGDIKLFDLRNMSLRWETNIKNGVCSLEFDRKDISSLDCDRKDISVNKLVATSLEGKFHVFDMRTQHPTKGFASVSEKVNKREMSSVKKNDRLF